MGSRINEWAQGLIKRMQREAKVARRLKNDGKARQVLDRQTEADLGVYDPAFLVWDDIYTAEEKPVQIQAIHAEEAAKAFGATMDWKNIHLTHLVYVREPGGAVTMWGVRHMGGGRFSANRTCVS